MRHRIVFFLLALLGFFGPGRLDESQAGAPAPGAQTGPGIPPIDRQTAPRTASATFALG